MAKKNSAAVALGRKGGKKRAENLTARQLSEQGRAAALARWKKQDGGGPRPLPEVGLKIRPGEGV